MSEIELVVPDWPAPTNVKAVTTTRIGGASEGRFASMNLGDGVGDDPARVRENRRRVRSALNLPSDPVWMKQVHGNEVCDIDNLENVPIADGSYCRKPGRVCAILTADCLPVFFCENRGTAVALAHAGWRGLAAGVIASTLKCLNVPTEHLMVWLGPAIGPEAYEVGDDVRQHFLGLDKANADAFVPGRSNRWMADLYSLARRQLTGMGVTDIYGGKFCTHRDAERFFSYRRDGQCGRMASLIWIE